MKTPSLAFLSIIFFFSMASASATGFYTAPCADLHEASLNAQENLQSCVDESAACAKQSQDYLQALVAEHHCEVKSKDDFSKATPRKS